MKLRIKGSSLRLRLTRGEVQRLDAEGELAEQVHFGPGAALTYRLRTDKASTDITATYSGNIIDILIPDKMARQWSRTDEVTLARNQPLPAAQGGSEDAPSELRVVIEKDWACLAPRSDEDESDNYPHPEVGSGNAC